MTTHWTYIPGKLTNSEVRQRLHSPPFQNVYFKDWAFIALFSIALFLFIVNELFDNCCCFLIFWTLDRLTWENFARVHVTANRTRILKTSKYRAFKDVYQFKTVKIYLRMDSVFLFMNIMYRNYRETVRIFGFSWVRISC